MLAYSSVPQRKTRTAKLWLFNIEIGEALRELKMPSPERICDAAACIRARKNARSYRPEADLIHENLMQLTSPRILTFILSLILALLAVVSLYTRIPSIGPWINGHRFWMMVAAYVILALGVVFRRL